MIYAYIKLKSGIVEFTGWSFAYTNKTLHFGFYHRLANKWRQFYAGNKQ
jgi:hypothetical protein